MTTTPITHKLQQLAAAFAVAAIAAFAGASVARADNSTVANVNFVSLSSSTVVADGSSTATLEVCASDSSSSPVADATLTFSASPNPFSGKPSAIFDTPVNLGNGCYTDTVHSLGAYTTNVSAYVPSGPSSVPQPVQFNPGPATKLFCNQSPVSPTDNDGTAAITCNAADANNNLETTGGDTVSLSVPAGAGSVSAPVDNGNGSYTWTRALPAYRVSSGFISPTINGSSSGSSVAATVVASATSTLASGSTFDRVAGTSCAGTYDLMTKCVHADYVDPTNAPADGSSIDAISFSLLDKYAQPNPSDAASAVVACSTTLPGTTITKINRGNGWYWLYLTSTTPGTGKASCTVNGVLAANVATFTFTPVAAPTPPPPAPTPPPAPAPAPAPAPTPPPTPVLQVGAPQPGDGQTTFPISFSDVPGAKTITVFVFDGHEWVPAGDGKPGAPITIATACMPDGSYQAKAEAKDAAGNVLLTSLPVSFTLSRPVIWAPSMLAVDSQLQVAGEQTLTAERSTINGVAPRCYSWLVNGDQVATTQSVAFNLLTANGTLEGPVHVRLEISAGDNKGLTVLEFTLRAQPDKEHHWLSLSAALPAAKLIAPQLRGAVAARITADVYVHSASLKKRKAAASLAWTRIHTLVKTLGKKRPHDLKAHVVVHVIPAEEQLPHNTLFVEVAR